MPSMPGLRSRGFTLLELMVVVALIAITTAVASVALPDPATSRLEKEAARLVAFLESSRAQARSGGMTVIWMPQPTSADTDFQFLGLPANETPSLQWMEREVKAEVVDGRSIVLHGRRSGIARTPGTAAPRAMPRSAAPSSPDGG